MDQAIIEGFKKFDTTSVSDALDRLGIVGGLHGIRPVIAETKFCGPAFTVHYVPCGTIKGTVGDFLDDVAPGQVVVLDNGGRTYCTVWGDLMTINASMRGIAGTVIDGVCRDVPGIRQVEIPDLHPRLLHGDGQGPRSVRWRERSGGNFRSTGQSRAIF